MMKKVAPLALLIGSTVAVDNFIYSTTWDAGATAPTPATGGDTAANCCYFTGDFTIGNAGAVTPTPTTNAAYAGAQTAAGRCDAYYAGTNNAFQVTAITVTTSSTVGQTTADPTTAGTAGLLLTVAKDGQTAVLTTSSRSGQTYVCKQTLTRKSITAPTVPSGSTAWTPAAGVLSGSATAATCCFLTVGKNLVINSASGVVKTSTAVTDTSDACLQNTAVGKGGEYIQTLAAGPTGVTAVNLVNANQDQFVLSTTASPNTLTFTPRGAAGCTQTLTLSTSSSAIAKVGAVSVVGAVLGMGLLVV